MIGGQVALSNYCARRMEAPSPSRTSLPGLLWCWAREHWFFFVLHDSYNFPVTFPASGTRLIRVDYSGDNNVNPSFAIYNAFQVYDNTYSSTSLGVDLPNALVGNAITLTAVVSSDQLLPPTGSVTFLDGSTVLGTSALDATGTAVLVTQHLGRRPTHAHRQLSWQWRHCRFGFQPDYRSYLGLRLPGASCKLDDRAGPVWNGDAERHPARRILSGSAFLLRNSARERELQLQPIDCDSGWCESIDDYPDREGHWRGGEPSRKQRSLGHWFDSSSGRRATAAIRQTAAHQGHLCRDRSDGLVHWSRVRRGQHDTSYHSYELHNERNVHKFRGKQDRGNPCEH